MNDTMILTGAALAFVQMSALRRLMGKRSAAGYRRAEREQLDALLIEIRRLAARPDLDAVALGQDLYALKQGKPPGLSWAAHLADLGLPLTKHRADQCIRVFRGGVTALEIKAKTAARMRKMRAERADVTTGDALKTLENFRPPVRAE